MQNNVISAIIFLLILGVAVRSGRLFPLLKLVGIREVVAPERLLYMH